NFCILFLFYLLTILLHIPNNVPSVIIPFTTLPLSLYVTWYLFPTFSLNSSTLLFPILITTKFLYEFFLYFLLLSITCPSAKYLPNNHKSYLSNPCSL